VREPADYYRPAGGRTPRYEIEWGRAELRKETAVKTVHELSRQGWDVFFNIADGRFEEDRAGIEVIEALEHYNCAFTGADLLSCAPHPVGGGGEGAISAFPLFPALYPAFVVRCLAGHGEVALPAPAPAPVPPAPISISARFSVNIPPLARP
jgi:hypothetical protein